MNNPILLSESFERAADAHRRAMDNFRVDGFEESVREFIRSIDKLQRILGMQAENDQRKHLGHSMAYDEGSFLNVQ